MVAAVIGIGQTAYSRASRRSEWSLAVEAIDQALADSGIAPGDVDGLVRYSYDSVDEAMLVRSFGWRLGYYSQTGYGGLGAPAVLAHARAAIESGQARVVVCFRSLNGYSTTRYGRAERSLGSGGEASRRPGRPRTLGCLCRSVRSAQPGPGHGNVGAALSMGERHQ